MRFGVIVAARSGSKRLPGKVLLPLMGVPCALFLMKRLSSSALAREIILATTTLPEDDRLAEIIRENGFDVFRGAVDDVMGRYIKAADSRNFDHIVRVTADCPFVDGETLDEVLKKCVRIKKFDLVTTKPRYPHGIDYEIFPKRLLEEIDADDNVTSEDREHMLNYVYRNEGKYAIIRLDPPPGLKLKEMIFLIDTQSNYDNIQALLHGVENANVSVVDLIDKYKYQLRPKIDV